TSICSGNLVEFITNVVDNDSETLICSGNFVFTNAMLYENISTLFRNTNTYDGGVAIADFGSASKSDDSLVSIFGKYFTIEYADLQFFINIPPIIPTVESDIYSLGIMLWELTSRIRPYSKHLNNYSRLYMRCWSTNPKQRPKLREILREIHKIKKNRKDIYNDISNC
ncbi:25442_t:CDS:2, partial [Gigaspora rosea]